MIDWIFLLDEEKNHVSICHYFDNGLLCHLRPYSEE